MPTADDVKMLFAEFPRNAISWRAQSVTKDGEKAMALAYIDARDVMDRLDSVLGAENWQDRYEFAGPRTICYLSVKIDGEWVTKADGAGDTAVEAEKGAISDAFKRAAVKWGIGRYLYDLDAPWVPCESTDWNGKKQWKRWKADPWSFVRGASRSSASMRAEKDARGDDLFTQIRTEIAECKTTVALDALYKQWIAKARKDDWNGEWIGTMQAEFSTAKKKLIAEQSNDDGAFTGDRRSNGYVSTLQAG
jgi:hypothetical protein